MSGSGPRYVWDVDDSMGYDDDLYEIPPIDPPDEEENDASGPITIDATPTRRASTTNRLHAYNSTTSDTDVQITSCRLHDGTKIKAGDTVELHKPDFRQHGLHSGDFLRISKIVNTASNSVQLCGHRFLREKLNEVMMHLEVREDDDRPALVQGLINVDLKDVKKKREIILTTKPYPMLSFRDQPATLWQRTYTKEDIKRHIFEQGPLVCRWTWTTIISPNGKAYGCIMRLLTESETLRPDQYPPRPQHIQSPAASHDQRLRDARLGKRPVRTPSLEVLDDPTVKRRRSHPVKQQHYTYVDICCGAGGSSRGAVQAGLKIIAGLDFDELAIEAWEKNNPDGSSFCIDAFEFIDQRLYKHIGRIHVLSISNPCQPYSCAHTIKGRDDEMNIKALDFIKPLLEHLKPRILVLENTAGLVNMEKNQAHFNRLLRNIASAQPGYSVSYKVVNMVDYGLPQPRKRLIIIAARRGVPVPPFPKPTHGPSGSGLLPYVSIGDALEKMERFGHLQRASNDPYHQPHKMPVLNGAPYDAYRKFINCILKSGVETLHPSGKRAFTPRELAVLQSLPQNHHLTGSYSRAIGQVGNMFPPLMAELVYRSCAQTLEAFDHGFITAEDNIEDLDITLIEKDVVITEPAAQAGSLFSPNSSAENSQHQYRYLRPPQLSDAAQAVHSSAWQTRTITRRARPSPPTREQRHTVPSKSRREKQFWDEYNGKTIDLSTKSDEEADLSFV
ncbi:hypothetical protein ACET3X_009317 [Alternaria dauci]|uniref:DNA (cytosine-5-)-methyltransferase n=1 Tax=Alternaria dauci TaxID=48095 RepID=A0ABR3U8H5_9PLEO